MKILFVHPEGNLSNNPALSAMTALLASRGHDVVVRGPAGRFFRSDHAAVRLVTLAPRWQRLLTLLARDRRSWVMGGALARVRTGPLAPYDVIVGVDPQGIVEGAAIADAQGAPLAYVSYEIYFADECGLELKLVEREAARRIVFAVAADDLRAGLLARETAIPRERIHCIPVGGAGTVPGERTWLLHDALAIPRHCRIAILAGSVTPWTAAPEIVDSVRAWPEDWVLVLHDRYGAIPGVIREAQRRRPDRIYLSRGNLPTLAELGAALHSADLGLAFYAPTYDSRWTGANVANIGMSSGKIATYLQHGLPIVTNEIGEMAEHTRREGLGIVVERAADIAAELATFDPAACRQRCIRFFERHLDACLHIDRFERALLGARDRDCWPEATRARADAAPQR